MFNSTVKKYAFVRKEDVPQCLCDFVSSFREVFQIMAFMSATNKTIIIYLKFYIYYQ